MVTSRKRWPDPFNGGQVRDDSVDLGPGGASARAPGSIPQGNNVGHMRPPSHENLKGLQVWNLHTGRTILQKPAIAWGNQSIKARRDGEQR